MRLYVADSQRRARMNAATHASLAVLAAASVASSLALGVVVGWHLVTAVARGWRAHQLGRIQSGYVDVTPGILVMTKEHDTSAHLSN